jgi:sugar phosphate isomerase/epimerase
MRSFHPISRRQALQQALGLGALAASPLLGQSKIPIAVQVYSVRKEAAADLAGTLDKLAKMGYQGVEFAGFYNHSTAAVKKMLADTGLKAFSSHTGIKQLTGDELKKSIDFHAEIGCRYMVVPSLPRTQTADGWKAHAGALTEIAGKLKPHKMMTGFHNHAIEFVAVEGKVPMEILFDNTPSEVIMQLDVGHAVRAGADPIAYINKYKGRSRSLHIKDFSPDSEDILLGQGVVKWPEVFRAATSAGGTEIYIIEQERYPFPPLECVERCLKTLKQMLGRA